MRVQAVIQLNSAQDSSDNLADRLAVCTACRLRLCRLDCRPHVFLGSGSQFIDTRFHQKFQLFRGKRLWKKFTQNIQFSSFVLRQLSSITSFELFDRIASFLGFLLNECDEACVVEFLNIFLNKEIAQRRFEEKG